MIRPSIHRIVCTFLVLTVASLGFAREAKHDANKDEDKKEDSFVATMYSVSVFLHGYAHGYEEGFHNADVDIHMAHGFRDVSTLNDFKKVADCPSNTGEKKAFERGYRQGFRVGYVDGMSGRSFRAVQSIRLALDGLSASDWSARRHESFENGIEQGYFAGETEGLHDGRTAAAFRLLEPGCTALGQSSPATKDADFCDGFQRAFAIGYSDGYTNQQDNPHVAVK